MKRTKKERTRIRRLKRWYEAARVLITAEDEDIVAVGWILHKTTMHMEIAMGRGDRDSMVLGYRRVRVIRIILRLAAE